MKGDIEIAESIKLFPIDEIASRLGLKPDEIEHYGLFKAKLKLDIRNSREPGAKTILVTAMTPTSSGEGKTTISIGLADALNSLGKKTIVTLRQPSLGPVFGVKGGATGAGYSQVLPMSDINLHFTGDIHAVGAAHNLLAAMVDNYYSRSEGTSFCTLPRGIIWNRTLDMNDRALRDIVIGLGEESGQVRESNFEITAASEIMAILGLSYDLEDLKQRLGNIIVAIDETGKPLHADMLKAQGAMAILLKEAIKPNLVQTIKGNPAIIHTGPFANIAHGTNSLISMDIARRLADAVVIESGFGSDLGGEKFFDLVSRRKNACPPDVVVIVATAKALKNHGGVGAHLLNEPNVKAIEDGFPNLRKHIENMKSFNRPVVVAVNRFQSDTSEELDAIIRLADSIGAKAFIADVWSKDGLGTAELAKYAWECANESHGEINYVYDFKDPIAAKVEKIADRIYGSAGVHFPRSVKKKIKSIEEWGYGELPVCMAKTQYSLSDDANLRGRPVGDTLEVKNVKVCAGAGFIVVYAGEIMTMPGLPDVPAAMNMDIDKDGKITGLF